MRIINSGWILSFSFFVPGLVLANVDPSYIKVKIYGVAVSTNSDCSNPIKIFHSSTAVDMDFLQGPTLGSGSLADGTYKCVMITMSDNIKFSPQTNIGTHCVAGTEYTIDVCRGSGTGGNNCRTQTFDGTSIPAAPTSANANGTDAVPVADIVTLYLSTGSTGAGNETFLQPTGTSNYGLPLGSPFVVSGTKTGTFVVNAVQQVADDGTNCGLDAPAFTFR